MKFEGQPSEARIIARLNRFAVMVEAGGRQETVHLPNSGRLRELLVPGRRALLWERGSPGRKTRYDLVLVRVGRCWACADARMPPSLVAEALALGSLPQFAGFPTVRREVVYEDSRLDLALSNGRATCFIEVKSVTLVEAGRALFPDAPTLRGTRHLNTLAHAVSLGNRAAVIFVVQRPDAASFTPNDAADPVFGETLRHVQKQGVEVYAYRCRVTPKAICLASPIPIDLRAGG